MSTYLIHSQGPWKKHKYLKKVGDSYVYSNSKSSTSSSGDKAAGAAVSSVASKVGAKSPIKLVDVKLKAASSKGSSSSKEKAGKAAKEPKEKKAKEEKQKATKETTAKSVPSNSRSKSISLKQYEAEKEAESKKRCDDAVKAARKFDDVGEDDTVSATENSDGTYTVTVTKADGKVVTHHLDKEYKKVKGTRETKEVKHACYNGTWFSIR